MQMTGVATEPQLAFLPWELPLEQWPEDVVVALPRGISRHIVRFVRLEGTVYAIKEVEFELAEREYRLLTDLNRREIPAVEPVAIVSARFESDGEAITCGLDHQASAVLAALSRAVLLNTARRDG